LYHIHSDEEIVYESTNKEEKITAVSIAKDASFFVHAFGSKFTFANTKVTERFISCWDGLQRNFSVAVTPSPKDCLRSHEDKFCKFFVFYVFHSTNFFIFFVHVYLALICPYDIVTKRFCGLDGFTQKMFLCSRCFKIEILSTQTNVASFFPVNENF